MLKTGEPNICRMHSLSSPLFGAIHRLSFTSECSKPTQMQPMTRIAKRQISTTVSINS